ncbi:DUF3772 domain-containing protein [Roseivivax sp. GX 12232]|uniref:DUF3772 domain-containing protein n=1 Tax=Roseivivax sp. GX 12232 TaxID=2900547 RepID=UPI001E568C6E|nr:DUF3772 domain-containing protein [Roseivivax sp. GX 12232]MCE0503728.1 DUF3772 domain-containing protein [Roseivivax sp. GX 12232]
MTAAARWLRAAGLAALLALAPGGLAAQEDGSAAETAAESAEEIGQAATGRGGAVEDSSPDPAPRAETVDFDAWNESAERIEKTLADGQASTSLLERIRGDLVAYRERFSILQNEQNARVQTLQAQLDALGPAPEEGQEEAADIAERRAALSRQLEEARAPVLTAEEAYTRADGLIREIDGRIRARAAERLFSQGPTPLNPALWPTAVEELLRSFRAFVVETEGEFADGALSTDRESLPIAVVLILLGLLLLARGRHWAERGVRWLRNTISRRASGVWRFAASLGMIVLPLIGIILISYGLRLTGLIGARGELILESLPVWVGILVYVRWLAQQSFSSDDDEATLPLENARRTEARVYFSGLSVLVVLGAILNVFTEADDYSSDVVAVLSFPIIAVASLLLFRLGMIFRGAAPEAEAQGEEDDPDPVLFWFRVARLLGRILIVTAFAAPIFAAAGYLQVALALTFPMIATLVLAGTLLVLLRVIADVYHLVTGRTARESNSLVPVFAGFLLMLCAFPVLALIWGARVSDLTELWTAFTTGFQLGESRISPADFLYFIAVFLIGFAITRGLQGGLRSSVLPKTRIDIGGRNAIVAGIGYIGIFTAAIVAFTAAGIDLSSIALVAGALSVGIGFGLQNIVSNFVSGIILLIERPISQGDWIAVGDNMGFVKDISVRSTRIETFDRFDVIVPNSDLVSGTVTNYTRGNTLGRLIVPIRVAYGSDTRKVQRILLSIARAHPLVLMNPAPYVWFKGFAESGIEFEIRVILTDILEIFEVQTEMNHQIAERFSEEDIQIPFPQRDLWLRNAEALTGQGVPDHRAFAAEGQTPQSMEDKGPLSKSVRSSTGGGDPDGGE